MSQKGPITVSVTNGDATVTASGQDFLTSLAAGNTFTVVGSGVSYQIGSITNNNEFELTGNYAGSTNASASAVIQTSYTTNRSLPKLERGDIETATIFGRLATLLDSLVGSFSTVTATGVIGGTATGAWIANTGATTSARFVHQANTGGNAYVGLEGSVGGVTFTGSTAYDMLVGGRPISFSATNGSAVHMRLSPTALTPSVSVTPTTDNTYDLGSASLGWKEVFADNGTINTSDARRKTAVAAMLPAELAAARDLAREIGSFQFLAAVAAKGESARRHIGMTVQRAIEIMAAHGLDPFAYSFICHDAWDDEFIEHPAIEAAPAQPAVDAVMGRVRASDGSWVSVVLDPARAAVPAQEAVPAWTEQTRVAGDRYAFRVHELLLFIARGVEARLTATEVNFAALLEAVQENLGEMQERLTALESAAG